MKAKPNPQWFRTPRKLDRNIALSHELRSEWMSEWANERADERVGHYQRPDFKISWITVLCVDVIFILPTVGRAFAEIPISLSLVLGLCGNKWDFNPWASSGNSSRGKEGRRSKEKRRVPISPPSVNSLLFDCGSLNAAFFWRLRSLLCILLLYRTLACCYADTVKRFPWLLATVNCAMWINKLLLDLLFNSWEQPGTRQFKYSYRTASMALKLPRRFQIFKCVLASL